MNIQLDPSEAMAPLKKPLTIVFALPGRSFSDNFLKSWSELLVWCCTNNIRVCVSSKYTSNVYYVRSMCLGGCVTRGVNQKPFDGKIDYDYIMWIDSDIVFDVEQFKTLLRHGESGKNIVSGLYLMQNGNQYTMVKDWDKEYYKKHGHFEFLDIKKHQEMQKKYPNKLISVSYIGFGFLLTKKGVFESLKYPWFEPIYEDFGDGIADFGSEDVSFCKKIIKNGFKIFVDLSIIVGHEKSIILHPSTIFRQG